MPLRANRQAGKAKLFGLPCLFLACVIDRTGGPISRCRRQRGANLLLAVSTVVMKLHDRVAVLVERHIEQHAGVVLRG